MSSARKLAVVAVALLLCAVLTIAATSKRSDPYQTRITTPTTTEPVEYAP